MDDLPELPFEQVLSYLNLKDRLKARTVSRAWRNTFDSYPVKTLCYSSRPSGFIFEKGHWVSGAFAENFINSTRFTTFFNTFGQTILSSLKHLRLCDIDLSERDRAAFARILNSFGQLEQLDIIRAKLDQQEVFNLPMLTSLQFEEVKGILNLTVEAPRLREVKMRSCYSRLRVEIIHRKSVERLLVGCLGYIEVKNLKNLQYLYVYGYPSADSTFLSSLPQLKEIHLHNHRTVSELFLQMQQSGRTDLKIYLKGLLLNGPHDPAINTLDNASRFLSREWLACFSGNQSRLADRILFYYYLIYSSIEKHVPLGLEVDLLKRCPDLNKVQVYSRVQDIERFLNLLKNFKNIDSLTFYCTQSQDLFDRLPEHSAVQWLTITRPLSDLAFLFRLKHLIHLQVHDPIDSETVRRAFEELPSLSSFRFSYERKSVSIEICQSKQFTVWVDSSKKTVSDLNAAIEFITEK